VITIGTRGSALALAQARLVAERLGADVELRVLRTAGDLSDRPIRELGDGMFVTAIEDALRASEIDLAVHSLKDLPTEEPADLLIAAIPAREDERDVLVTRDRGGLAGLPHAAVVGTSSPRRAAFLRASIGDAARDLVERGADHVVGICMSPQWSPRLMGGYADALAEAASRARVPATLASP